MLRWYYSVDADTVLEITDRVRTPGPDGGDGISVGAHAEEGSGWEGTINVDDEDGDLVLLMHRRIYCVDDAAPADHQVVGNWFITNLDVIRGTPPVLASRIWVVTLADENSLLSRRIFVGGDNDRPAETDIERIRWLLTTTELNTLDPDEDFIDTTDPVDMDAVDYIGQKPEQVLSDCSQQSGKNYWVMYREDLTPNVYGLAYFNAATSDLYPSAISLSNVESEIDSTTIFAISDDTRLSRAGGRSPTSGVYLPYAGGYVYEQDTLVGDTYVYRDVAMPSVNVKTAAKATARAELHLLVELAEPDDEVETEIIVGAETLNDAMHGMWLNLHHTALPPYYQGGTQPRYALADGQDMRIMRRQVRQLAPTTFGVRLWLTPMKPIPCPDYDLTPDGYRPPLGTGVATAEGNTYYSHTGLAHPEEPAPFFGSPPDPNVFQWHFSQFMQADAGAHNPAGWTDSIFGEATNTVCMLPVGPGTATVYTRIAANRSAGAFNWYLQHRVPGAPNPTSDAVGIDIVAGTTFDVVVPDDGFCVHFITLDGSTTPSTPYGGAAFDGWDWAGA